MNFMSIFLPLVAALARDKKLECHLGYTVNALTNSTTLAWDCSTALTEWESLIIDFDLLLEKLSIFNGTITMKWNKTDCMKKKINESPNFVTSLPETNFPYCINQSVLTSKIPCNIGPNFRGIFTKSVEREVINCLYSNIPVEDPVILIKRQDAEIWNATTFAGTVGVAGSTDGLGMAATFRQPTGITIDSNGNIYVLDLTSHIIRKITPNGTVATFAGKAGVVGSTDGIGSAARFNYPYGITIDSNGNLFVVETNNQLIRKITPSGMVTTFAGSAGASGSTDGVGSVARFKNPYGIATDSNDNLYVADTNNYLIRKITPGGAVTTFAGSAGTAGYIDGVGSAARFNLPFGITIDSSGNLYITEIENQLIRKITPNGTVTTIAGAAGVSGYTDGVGSGARFNFPFGIAVDMNGNLFVSEWSNHLIRKITPSGLVTTIAGSALVMGSTDGVGANARFRNPVDLSIDSFGNLFVTEQFNHLIRRISLNCAYNAFGNQTCLSSGYLGSTRTVKNGYITQCTDLIFQTTSACCFINSEWSNFTACNPQGISTRSRTGTSACTTELLEAKECCYTSDWTNAPNAECNSAIGSIAQVRTKAGNCDSSVITTQNVPCSGSKINESWNTTTIAGTTNINGFNDGVGSDSRFDLPNGIAIDSLGNQYVADSNNHIIRKISPDGTVTTIAGSAGAVGASDGIGSAAKFNIPTGITFDSYNNLYVADSNNHIIRRITPNGNVTTIAGSAGAVGASDGIGSAAKFNIPTGITFDSYNNLYVADSNNHIIRKITLNGVVTTFAGGTGVSGFADGLGSDARFYLPKGIVIDLLWNVYVADTNNHIIRKIANDGTVTTIAGSAGVLGATDGIGSAGKFNFPTGITVDLYNNLFVADHNNHLIRKILPNGNVTSIAGSAGLFGSNNGVGSVARFRNPYGIAINSAGKLYITDYQNNLVRSLSLICIYGAYGNQTCLSSGYLGKSRMLSIGYPAQCTDIISQTNSACCFINSEWSSFTACNSQGISTRSRTGTSACTTELSETKECCYTSNWTNAPNAECNTTSGYITQLRTKTGNCDSAVITTKNAPCCQIGLWVAGSCQSNGTLTKTRTVSQLCPINVSSSMPENCCYISDWNSASNVQCDRTTGVIAQVRTKAGNCEASIVTTRNSTCCQLGQWISGSCQPNGSISLSKYCPNNRLRRKPAIRVFKTRKNQQSKCFRL